MEGRSEPIALLRDRREAQQGRHLSYVVGVRSMDGTAEARFGLETSPNGRTVVLENTGTAWDIYRLAATGAELANALVAIAPGGTAQVVVPEPAPQPYRDIRERSRKDRGREDLPPCWAIEVLRR